MLELADKILGLTKSSSKITFLPLPGDDPLQRQPAIAYAKKVLGWEPKISLDEGLKKTIDYYKKLSA